MKNLLLAIGCVVGGFFLFLTGVSQLSDPPAVKCGDTVMHQSDHCNRVGRHGTAYTNDYAAEKKINRNVTISSLVFGPLLVIGGSVWAFAEIKRRRNVRPRIAAPDPELLPQGDAVRLAATDHGAGAMPGNPYDFARPTELACVLDADAVTKRLWFLFAMIGALAWLVSAVALGLMFPKTTPVWLGGSIVIAVAIPVASYLAKRNQLRRHYGQLQRLILHPGGLRRFDPYVVIDIPWTGISGLSWRNSALPSPSRVHTASALAGAANAAIEKSQTVMAAGIRGDGTIAPLPGASRRMLKIQDRLFGSEMARGYPHSGPDCVIFPAEFEKDWAAGVVGAWLRHYRPDLDLAEYR